MINFIYTWDIWEMTQKSHANDVHRFVTSLTAYNLCVKNQNQTQSTLS